MKFMEKVWGSLGLIEPVEDEQDQQEQKHKVDDIEVIKGKKGNNIVNLPTAQKQMKVMVVEPFSFDDAQHIADHLKNRKPVVVNFENCDKEVAMPILVCLARSIETQEGEDPVVLMARKLGLKRLREATRPRLQKAWGLR